MGGEAGRRDELNQNIALNTFRDTASHSSEIIKTLQERSLNSNAFKYEKIVISEQ